MESLKRSETVFVVKKAKGGYLFLTFESIFRAKEFLEDNYKELGILKKDIKSIRNATKKDLAEMDRINKIIDSRRVRKVYRGEF